jgi:hypothetical protein
MEQCCGIECRLLKNQRDGKFLSCRHIGTAQIRSTTCDQCAPDTNAQQYGAFEVADGVLASLLTVNCSQCRLTNDRCQGAVVVTIGEVREGKDEFRYMTVIDGQGQTMFCQGYAKQESTKSREWIYADCNFVNNGGGQIWSEQGDDTGHTVTSKAMIQDIIWNRK